MSTTNRKLLFSSIFLAFTSSLCCIAPLLAILGGVGAVSSSFDWVAPLRPYLIIATIGALGYSFYLAYKPQKRDDCGCEVEKKTFLQSKTFLWTITLVSALLLTFPYYSPLFQNNDIASTTIVSKTDHEEIVLNVNGMTCESCENHVNSALLQSTGVINVITDYEAGTSTITYNKRQITPQHMITIIQKETGYEASK